ncbi:MAG: hypothetical protein MUF10_04595 [Thermoanaerobaculaceae bacterium]|jgi:ribosomal protein S27E|nr:hypothetical protein [Thermoanaerobaculaceae bacterium]
MSGEPARSWVVRIPCPQCGDGVVVASAATGARCRSCGSAHLVTGHGGPTVLVVPDRVANAEEARQVFVADLQARRAVELGLALGRDRGASSVATGAPEPDTRAADAGEALAARWGERLDAETRVLSDVRLLAPTCHLAGRLWEGVIGRDRAGTKVRQARVRAVEGAARACEASLPLPDMGALSWVQELWPWPASGQDVAPVLEPVGLDERFAALGARLDRVSPFAGVEPALRHAVLWVTARAVVMRPFHVLRLACRGRSLAVLVDGGARTCVVALEDAEALRIERAPRLARPGSLPGALGLRPMRCPECGGDLPLQRFEEVRLCRTCGRAFSHEGGRLHRVAYRVEARGLSGDTALLPFWRLRFRLQEVGGEIITSLGQLRGKLRRRHAEPIDGSDGRDTLDVPAFRSGGRARLADVLWRRPCEGEPGPHRTLDGPVSPGSGLPRPARLISIGPAEATALARLALLLGLGERDLAGASIPNLRALLGDSRIDVSAPTLVLREVSRAHLRA